MRLSLMKAAHVALFGLRKGNTGICPVLADVGYHDPQPRVIGVPA
jgi:hypothetical protein